MEFGEYTEDMRNGIGKGEERRNSSIEFSSQYQYKLCLYDKIDLECIWPKFSPYLTYTL
jgi:hypothetical protein